MFTIVAMDDGQSWWLTMIRTLLINKVIIADHDHDSEPLLHVISMIQRLWSLHVSTIDYSGSGWSGATCNLRNIHEGTSPCISMETIDHLGLHLRTICRNLPHLSIERASNLEDWGSNWEWSRWFLCRICTSRRCCKTVLKARRKSRKWMEMDM